MGDEIRHHGIKIGILTVPTGVVQNITDRMVSAGIEEILNYAPISLILRGSVCTYQNNPVHQSCRG